MEEKKKEEVEHVDLPNEMALSLALGSERLATARTTVELRETQLQSMLNSLNVEFSENGKYRVVDLNVEKRKVGRVRVYADVEVDKAAE